MPIATLAYRKTWSDEQLESLPKNGNKYELLDRELIMSPVHANHSVICARFMILLGGFVQRHKLGETFDSSIGFRLSPDALLSPDISFASKARLKKILVAPDKFLQGAPDLAVEVLSPSERLKQIHQKLDLYFEYGTRLVWMANWRVEQVHIYRHDSIEALTRPTDLLSGGEVVPGFKCRLSQIFRPV